MPAERRGAITGASPGLTSTDIINNNKDSMSSGFSFGSSTFGAPAPSTAAPLSFGTPAPAPSSGGGFAFGSTPAPAPSTGGFSFGPTPAPAPSTGFSFGSTPAPAPATGGFGFGGTPAPAPGGFGSPAPAPSTSLFGTSTSSSLFGTPAPAPTGSLFGSTAPAPSGSLFGTPAPAPFGQPMAAAPYAPPPSLAGHMQYMALPPDQKQAIDRLHQAMMHHKRTIMQVSSMAPKLLNNPQQADIAAGTQDLPLALHVQKLESQVETLQQQIQTLRNNVDFTRNLYETSTSQAIVYAQWPTELVAMRRGVPITKPKNTMDKDIEVKLREALDRANLHVDRVESIPSPYLWQVLEEMEQRISNLTGQVESLSKALESSKQIPSDTVNVVTIIRMQDQAIWKIASALASAHSQVDDLRNQYNHYEKGTNVIEAAEHEERQRQQYLDHKLREQMIKSLPSGTSKPNTQAPGGGLFGAAPAPSSTSLFGAPSSAPGAFSFASTPAPATSSLFGSSPAPAPFGGLSGFSSTPAQAPGSSLFGSNPAPAPAFGSSAAPAPSPFGSTPAPAPGTSLFGATPAPSTSTTTTAFGGGFASTTSAGTSATASTPKSKNKSRSTRRR